MIERHCLKRISEQTKNEQNLLLEMIPQIMIEAITEVDKEDGKLEIKGTIIQTELEQIKRF